MKPVFGRSTPGDLASWRAKPQYGAALLNSIQPSHIREYRASLEEKHNAQGMLGLLRQDILISCSYICYMEFINLLSMKKTRRLGLNLPCFLC